jgi:CheY-like chemotaxis protein
LTRVLVADDDPDYRLVVRLALDGFADVLEAADGAELVEVAGRGHPDIVLLDVSLAGGFEALPRLPAPAKLVLVSSRPPDELAAMAAATGAVGYVGKDVAPSELPRALADFMSVVDRLESLLAKAFTRLPAELRSAGEARSMVRRTLAGWCDEELLDDIALCVSELVTNAVVHAASEPRILVQVRPSVIHVEISDDSDVMPVVKHADPHDTSGRGMAILGGLSDRWGSRRRSGAGKTVWFDITRSAARTATGTA